MSTHVMKIRHYLKKFVMTSKSSSWCQDVCHEVKMFVMKSTTRHDVKSQKYVKILSWSQTHFMTSQSSLWHQKVRHGVKNMLWWQKVRHCFKKFIMTRHDVKSLWKRQKYVMKSKTFHEVTKCVMTSKRRHDFNNVVMMSKTYHDVKKFTRHGVKNMLWWQKVRLCFKKSSWHVMTSKVCHEVKSLSWSQKLSWSQNMLWRQWHQKRIMT